MPRSRRAGPCQRCGRVLVLRAHGLCPGCLNGVRRGSVLRPNSQRARSIEVLAVPQQQACSFCGGSGHDRRTCPERPR